MFRLSGATSAPGLEIRRSGRSQPFWATWVSATRKWNARPAKYMRNNFDSLSITLFVHVVCFPALQGNVVQCDYGTDSCPNNRVCSTVSFLSANAGCRKWCVPIGVAVDEDTTFDHVSLLAFVRVRLHGFDSKMEQRRRREGDRCCRVVRGLSFKLLSRPLLTICVHRFENNLEGVYR